MEYQTVFFLSQAKNATSTTKSKYVAKLKNQTPRSHECMCYIEKTSTPLSLCTPPGWKKIKQK